MTLATSNYLYGNLRKRVIWKKAIIFLTFIFLFCKLFETKVPHYGITKLTPSQIFISIAKGAEILALLSGGTDRITDLSNKLRASKSIVNRFLIFP